MVRAFHRNGNCVKRRTIPGRTPKPIPPDVEQYIKESLEENAFLSARMRCDKILQRFDFSMTVNKLHRTYKRMGIEYRRVKTVYKTSLNYLPFR